MDIEYYNDLVKSIDRDITILLEQTKDDKLRQDISGMRSDIDQLWIDIRSYGAGNSFDYNYIEIDFNGVYELSLPKYGVKSFDRKLKGLMYFNILNGTDNYIDIQTNSFPESFRIRLFYKTLDTTKNQKNRAFLIYRKGNENLKGEEEIVEYKIRTIK